MDNKVIASAALGGIVGAAAGFMTGRYVERKERSIEHGLASELFAVFGGLAGAVIGGALLGVVSPMSLPPTTNPVASNPPAPTPGAST